MAGWPELADAAILAGRDALGEDAVYTYPGPPKLEVDVRVIFDVDQVDQIMDGALVVGSREPMAEIRIADLPRPPRVGDLLTVRGECRAIRHVQPDGHGSASLVLDRPQ